MAALAGTGRPLRPIPRASGTELFVQPLPPWGRGAEVEGMKICPAAIVSQLFPSDSSGRDSSPEPLRLGGIQCIPDDNPRDSRPCLCAASPRALARTGPHRSGPGRCHLVLTSFLRSGRDCSEVWKFSSNSKILSFRSCPFA